MAVRTVPPGRPGGLAIVLLAAGGSLLALGALVTGFGPGAFDLPASPGGTIGPTLLAAGALAVAVAVAVGGRRLLPGVGAAVPRLYPDAGAMVQVGVFLLAVVSAAAVIDAIFAEFTGALAGGDSAAAPNPAVLNALYVVASALLWAFAVWIVLLIARVVRIGRAVEQAEGRNVYGRVEPEGTVLARPARVAPSPGPVANQRGLVLGATVIVALASMAAIQTVEVGGDPPTTLAWSILELATPVWAVGLGSAFLAIDRYVRDLEHRNTAPGPGGPADARTGSAADRPSRFVP